MPRLSPCHADRPSPSASKAQAYPAPRKPAAARYSSREENRHPNRHPLPRNPAPAMPVGKPSPRPCPSLHTWTGTKPAQASHPVSKPSSPRTGQPSQSPGKPAISPLALFSAQGNAQAYPHPENPAQARYSSPGQPAPAQPSEDRPDPAPAKRGNKRGNKPKFFANTHREERIPTSRPLLICAQAMPRLSPG